MSGLENNSRVVKSHLTINVHKNKQTKNSNKNLNEAWFYIADNRRRYCLRTNLFTKICCKKNPLKVPGAQNEYDKFTLKRRKY